MTRLSETQRTVLTAACQHPDRQVLPFPEHLNLRGGPVTKVVDSLLAKGLIAEVPQQPGQKLWRDGHGTTLIATDAAFAALGMMVPDHDGCEPEITGRYGEDDIPGTEDPGCFDPEPSAEPVRASEAGLEADVATAEAAHGSQSAPDPQVRDQKRLATGHGLGDDRPMATGGIPLETEQARRQFAGDIDRMPQCRLRFPPIQVRPKDPDERGGVPAPGCIATCLRVAQIRQVKVTDPDVLQVRGQHLLGKTWLPGNRNVPDIDQYADVHGPEGREKIGQGCSFVSDGKQRIHDIL